MKKVLFALLVAMLFVTSLPVSAAPKFSAYDFSNWTEVRTYYENFQDHDLNGQYRFQFTEDDTDLIPEGWTYKKTSGEENSEFRDENGQKGFFPFPSSELYTAPITGPYVFTFNTRLSSGKMAGYFVRASKEKIGGLSFSDIDGSNIEGKGDILGGSGISFRPADTTLNLYVKKYDENASKKVSNAVFEINGVATFVQTQGNYQNVQIIDNGSSVQIFIADVLVAKITFSDVKKYAISNEEFYSKATVYDGEGNVLGNVDNALISTKSVLAFAARDIIGIDEIKVTEYTVANPQTSDNTIAFGFVLIVVLALTLLTKKVFA